MDDKTFAAIANAYSITVEELSAHPDEAEKARAIHRLSKAVAQMESESVDILAGLAERMLKLTLESSPNMKAQAAKIEQSAKQS